MDEVLTSLCQAQHFTEVNLKAGYWRIAVELSDRCKTAFITQDGLYEFLVMPLGLISAPAASQRLMNTVSEDMMWHNVMVYLADIVVFKCVAVQWQILVVLRHNIPCAPRGY